jgi:uncharacterized repeat protein (TIGR01451 family)
MTMTMKKPTTLKRILLATLALSATQVVAAQEKGCIELKTTAETEQEYVDEKGQKAKRLVPAGKVTPGDEVVWTITARNVCDKPAENVVVANPIPEHMSYAASSAMGVGTKITYSLDNRGFKDAAALTVREADGSTRAARADEYRAIKWTYAAPFAPGATAFVRYRATVK